MAGYNMGRISTMKKNKEVQIGIVSKPNHYCPTCGNMCGGTTYICPVCKSAIKRISKDNTENVCPDCGESNRKEANYCIDCGKKLLPEGQEPHKGASMFDKMAAGWMFAFMFIALIAVIVTAALKFITIKDGETLIMEYSGFNIIKVLFTGVNVEGSDILFRLSGLLYLLLFGTTIYYLILWGRKFLVYNKKMIWHIRIVQLVQIALSLLIMTLFFVIKSQNKAFTVTGSTIILPIVLGVIFVIGLVMTLLYNYQQERYGNKEAFVKTILYIVLIIVGIVLIFPYVFMLLRSFMTPKDVLSIDPVYFLPEHGFEWANYKEVFKPKYMNYMFNTLKVFAFNVIAVPLSASVCAYAFAKIKFKGKEIVFGMVLSTIMISGSITQVPVYVLFADLGWTEGLYPLTIPALFGGGAMNIFLLRQFMRNIPNELEGAAKIDGAGTFRRYWNITIPLCLPIILYVCVGVFNSAWGDFYGPLIYLKSPSKYTLAVGIYYDLIANAVPAKGAIRMASGVFMSLPPLIIFLLYQRKLVDGIMVGGIKG